MKHSREAANHNPARAPGFGAERGKVAHECGSTGELAGVVIVGRCSGGRVRHRQLDRCVPSPRSLPPQNEDAGMPNGIRRLGQAGAEIVFEVV